MKKRLFSVALAVVLCMSMSLTAFASASSNRNNNSGNNSSSPAVSAPSSAPAASSSAAPARTTTARRTVENAKPGEAVTPSTVSLAVSTPSGAVQKISLDQYTSSVQSFIVSSAASAASLSTAVKSMTTVPVSKRFSATLNMVAANRGTKMVVNNMATVKTTATAKDPLGNTIASAGVIKNVTDAMLIMVMSVNTDGTVEYAEGRVDPTTGQVIAAFKGTPAVLSVFVLA